MASTASKFKQLMKKYGKVGIGVHVSISAASISALYVAINNNVDVESLLEKVGMGTAKTTVTDGEQREPAVMAPELEKKRNRTAELAATSGGAFALALLCNKALFPIRVPITLALTPPIARFLARRNLIKTSV
ncbi:uncharacterized protein LOC141648269 [Silene latifolia]|uniref:uncharacterized protein LOC141648269 n=1 Tax=Silene latifolia TaxID=37657 RepID=UPI003D78298F